MIPSKKSTLILLIGVALLMSACSGFKGSLTGGSLYSIGGNVTGLAGTNLVLVDNATDTLPILGAGTVPFTFKTSVSGAYNVTVKTQPTGPAQTCTVTGGQGTATGNVTTVAVSCTTNPVIATIGGTLSGLAPGASVILQNNGGDSLTLMANGPFVFTTPVTGPTDAYAVTVLTQPNSPLQICTVSNGSGTATGNVNMVGVSCVLAYTIGGSVTGLDGAGLILQNSDSEQLKIMGNGPFTFVNPVATGYIYTVTIAGQPTGPTQTCVVTPGTGSGTATANVTTVAITCPAVTYSVGGMVVGLEGIPPSNGPLTDSSFTIQNNLGNTLVVSENGPFTFATPEALNDQYNISVFTLPSTQLQGCTTWNYKGVVTASITSVVVDCAHNDWTWIDGTDTAGTIAAPEYGSFPASAPTTIPNPFTNTPGARYGGAGWTDKSGNLWLFGGDGWELSGSTQPDTLNAPMNDLWVCVMTGDFCQWQLVGGFDPTVIGTTTVGAQIIAKAQTEDQIGVYSNVGPALPYPTPVPGARWGAATWTDNAGNLWMFGGNGNSSSARGLLNDLWEFNASSFNAATITTTPGLWTWEGGTSLVNQPGTYSGASELPGARVGAVTWKDKLGNFWLFGGYGFDANGNEGFLNDLWEYTAGKWVFLSGGTTNTVNQLGVYGNQGSAAASNIPGGRQEAAGWTDALGNLWLFGGEGEDSLGTANGILNDLWMYNTSNNQWTYVLGSSTANQTGAYGLQPLIGPPSTTSAAGTLGLTGATAGTLPGSRWGASAWTDAGGNLWLFGGWGLDSTATNGNGALNDLWVYTPAAVAGQAGTWTWIKGSNTGSDNGLYGTLTRPYLTYYIWTPGGRSNATHWVDGNGQLWLFGGEGYDSTSTTGNGYLNDMWRYLPYPN